MRKRKILIAPSPYKGSLTAIEIAAAIKSGLSDQLPEVQLKCMPMADGGDGTIATIQASLGGIIKQTKVQGPLGEPVTATWLVLPKRIIIELASCCGLAMLNGKTLKPLQAHTYGLGEVISINLSESVETITIGVGGSASTDGGTGALAALGVKFLDSKKNILPLGGGFLPNLANIDMTSLDPRIKNKKIEILTDVRSPLLGTHGAAAVFSPQKGATAADIATLESGLKQLADITKALTGGDIRNQAGTGAAGGTAFGLAALLNASILPGFQTIAKLISLKEEIQESDLVITAEGRLDYQSLRGKATGEIAEICKRLNKPLWVLPATAEENIDWQRAGIEAVYPLSQENTQVGIKDIIKASKQIAIEFISGKK